MKILNYGSMNLDHVYSVPHFVNPGETISAMDLHLFAGGKGLNQSIAVAKAGGVVFHAGIVGEDGGVLLDALSRQGVNIGHIRQVAGPSAHTVIQVDPSGQNSIIVYSGNNMHPSEEDMDQLLEDFGPGDLLMLQNELFGSADMLAKAAAKGMKILFNPSPADDHIKQYPLHQVDWLILNEIEGALITGAREPLAILDVFSSVYPTASVVLTLGVEGAYLQNGGQRIYQPAFPVKAVDTTAAGDTFTGYFVAGLADGMPFDRIMKRAALAASIAVGRPGAADSIPVKQEVDSTEKSL